MKKEIKFINRFEEIVSPVVEKIKNLPQDENEFIDTIGDFVVVVAVGDKALEDGAQLEDLFALVRVQDEASDIYGSFREFVATFPNLTPEIALEAVDKAETLAINEVGELGFVTEVVIAIFRKLAKSYSRVEAERVDWLALVNKFKKDESVA